EDQASREEEIEEDIYDDEL
uniref:Si:dkey-117n7.3 n=2 Tax=Astyanax mexicanus TaxID=7994 RepID=A0A3B1IE75_ASTMX